ncbi:MAG: FadR family transcriptional regulator [Anaerolineales bacterium]|nr:FadR family transcriptional regulator [Anaerolineales bacterium]
MPTFDNSIHNTLSGFIRYLAHCNHTEDNLPALSHLSQKLNISVPTLREQLEVARAMGLVEVRPRTGIKRLPYSFTPAVKLSLSYAITRDEDFFLHFANLRKHIELIYWQEAVDKLTDQDKESLQTQLKTAQQKLNRSPVQIPHQEHRQLHTTIFSRLGNPFVSGILEAYWDAYELIGLNVLTELDYLKEMWRYHSIMVESICNNDIETGYKALNDHVDLLYQRAVSNK